MVLFGHCIVYPSTYGFLLSLWYLQNFSNRIKKNKQLKSLVQPLPLKNWSKIFSFPALLQNKFISLCLNTVLDNSNRIFFLLKLDYLILNKTFKNYIGLLTSTEIHFGRSTNPGSLQWSTFQYDLAESRRPLLSGKWGTVLSSIR
jgi:hypothetical protein